MTKSPGVVRSGTNRSLSRLAKITVSRPVRSSWTTNIAATSLPSGANWSICLGPKIYAAVASASASAAVSARIVAERTSMQQSKWQRLCDE